MIRFGSFLGQTRVSSPLTPHIDVSGSVFEPSSGEKLL